MIQKIFNARSLLVAAALSAVLPHYANSQTVLPAAKPAPPAPTYKSAFEGYRAYSDEPVGNWKAANDEVSRIGGWREYAKQAQELEAPPATKAVEGKPKATP